MLHLTCFLACALALQQGRELTDQQILEMGHARYIAQETAHAPHDPEVQFGAERRFGIATTRVNEKIIASRQDAKALKEIQIFMANITKGSMRLADAFTFGTPKFSLYIGRAEVSVSRALHGYLVPPASFRSVSQPDVWATYANGQEYLARSEARVREYSARGGFSLEQHSLSYQSIRIHMTELFRRISAATPTQKRVIFSYCQEMIHYICGGDPLSDRPGEFPP